MRILCLDISTHAGYAVFDDGQLAFYGIVKNLDVVDKFGTYPSNYWLAASNIAQQLAELVKNYNPDVIVVEETNLGKQRYTQKLLEFIHCHFLAFTRAMNVVDKITYISSSAWRKTIGVSLSKEDKKNNSKVYRAKKVAKETGVSVHAAKKALGVKGKVNKKHVAVRFVNEKFGLSLKVKDNDIADAICLGVAYQSGAQHCDGVREW